MAMVKGASVGLGGVSMCRDFGYGAMIWQDTGFNLTKAFVVHQDAADSYRKELAKHHPENERHYGTWSHGTCPNP